MESKQNKVISYIGMIAGACLLYAVSAGLRSVYGIMLGTISDGTGITYASVSFAIAVGQLVFGVAQPVFGKLFGSENLGTLFGIVFLCHQIGSFFSAWLGGRCVEATGSYVLIWSVAAILSLCAMIVSFCITEPNKHSYTIEAG
jgi:predicted MFS family arabinose efflux permease